MSKDSTPNKRASESKKEVERVRRRYKVNVNKSRKILPGERESIEHMVVVLRIAGYSKIQTARAIGIGRKQVAEILDDPKITDLVVSLRSRLPQAALDLLQGYMIEAVQAIVDVLRASQDDKYVLQAAGEILDRAGMPKASRQDRYNVNEERTVFTDDGMVERLREAPVEVQEKAATLIEELEGLLEKSAAETEEDEAEVDDDEA